MKAIVFSSIFILLALLWLPSLSRSVTQAMEAKLMPQHVPINVQDRLEGPQVTAGHRDQRDVVAASENATDLSVSLNLSKSEPDQEAVARELTADHIKLLSDHINIWKLGVILKTGTIKYWEELFDPEKRQSVCFEPDLGCFHLKEGPLKHVHRLPALPVEIETEFWLYTRNETDTMKMIHYNDTSSWLQVPTAASMVFLVHGFDASANDPHWAIMRQAFFNHTDIAAVVHVQWTKAAKMTIDRAVANCQLVGREIAVLIDRLRANRQVDTKNVHLVGFSLGGELVHFAGRWSIDNFGHKLGRISALDPGAPLFANYPGSHISKEDADFVDVIHVSGGNSLSDDQVALWSAVGHVDFYPHGGRRQPPCPPGTSLWCSHMLVPYYYIASLTGECEFQSIKCQDIDTLPWSSSPQNACLGESREPDSGSTMGYYSVAQPGRGKQFLNTTDVYPYC